MIYFLVCLSETIANESNTGEKIIFQSSNPFSFYHIITALNEQQSQDVYGIMRMPQIINGNQSVPLVIGVNGSKNWADHHREYLEMYRQMGFATFELHSFNSRKVSTTVGEQVSVTTAMMVLDAYKALEKLASDERIDQDRIAITGWSLGGGVALFSAWSPLLDAIGVQERFRAHLALYPPCLVDIELIEFSFSPIHILIGEKDDWVSANKCEDLVNNLIIKDVDIGITVYQGAQHGFDREGPLTFEKDGYSTINCKFNMRADGAVLMNIFDIPMITPLRQKIALGWCAARGTTIGGNPEARRESFAFAKHFMGLHLSKKN